MMWKLPSGIFAPILTAAVLLALLLTLNWGGWADAPFSGDNGLKMWQAASVASSGDLLVRPVPEGVVSSSYAPGLTSPTGEGLRGVYGTVFPRVMQLPSMGSTLIMRVVVLLLTLGSIPILSRLSGGGLKGTAAFFIAGLVPYSLVFWEHGPAVTLFLLGTLLLLEQLDSCRRIPWWLPVFAISCIWRPENAVCLAGLLAVVAASGRGLQGYRRTMMTAGISLVLLAALVAVMGPSLLPLHLRSNLPSFGGDHLRSRLEVLGSWSVPPGNLPALGGLILAVSAGGALLLRERLRIREKVLLLTRAVGLTGSLLVGYYFLRGSLGNMSLLSLSPGLLLLPFLPLGLMDRRSCIMVIGGLAGGLLIFLASPTDGMFQFGARFLLAPAGLVTAGLLRAAGDPVKRVHGSAILLPLAIAVVTLLGTVRAVVFQESFRRWHHDLSETMESFPEDLVVATDQSWLPLVIWRVAMTRPVLCIGSFAQADSLVNSGLELIWISHEGVPGWITGEPGYRGLRLSTHRGADTMLVLPGPASPIPIPFSF